MNALTRRRFVSGSAIAAASLTAWRGAWGRRGLYGEAMVIDGLGGLGNSAADDHAPLADEHLRDVRESGLTALHLTILPVGTTPPDKAFAQAVTGIGRVKSKIESTAWQSRAQHAAIS